MHGSAFLIVSWRKFDLFRVQLTTMRYLSRQLVGGLLAVVIALPAFSHSVAVLKRFSDAQSAYPDIPAWYAPTGQVQLAQPVKTKQTLYHLTLREAIWLALRNNPDVKSAEAQRVLDKFALAMAHWQFEPQYENQFTVSRDLKTGHTALQKSISANLSTQANTKLTAGYNGEDYTLSLSQPLLQGFMMNRLTYLGALDNEKLARLNFSQGIMQTVQSVIAQYMALVEAKNTLLIQQRQLKQTDAQLKRDTLKFKKGKLARSDYLQVKVQAAQYHLSLVQQKNALSNSYLDFLKVLGLRSSTQLTVDQSIAVPTEHIPSKQACIELALAHNLTYQSQKLTLKNDERALKQARNQLLPDVTLQAGSIIPEHGRVDNTIGVQLSVPLNAMDRHQAVLQAKVALQTQRIQLREARQQVIRDVTNQWNAIQADKSQIRIAEQSVKMQQQTVKDNQLLLKYGRTTVFDFLQIQNGLLSQQLSLVSTKINLINDMATLDNTMGVTLQRWRIHLRY
jgi:outer membrane protein